MDMDFGITAGADEKIENTKIRSFPMDTQLMRQLAKKYIWWMTPDDAVARPSRVVSQVMNIGDFNDVMLLIGQVGESYLRKVLENAEAGQFNERSWSYWHYRLGMVDPGHVPDLPARKFS